MSAEKGRLEDGKKIRAANGNSALVMYVSKKKKKAKTALTSILFFSQHIGALSHAKPAAPMGEQFTPTTVSLSKRPVNPSMPNPLVRESRLSCESA